MTTRNTPILSLDAHARVGSFDLEVRFEARPGITVLFGPTASGKSLTLRLAAGLTRVTRGAIMFDSRALDDGATFVAARDRNLGYAPQDGALWPHRTAREHLTPFTSASNAGALLGRVGLAPHGDRKPAFLSGGERQRLAFARAIARVPNMLLLDEPFSALDDAARADMGALVRAEADRGAIVLFVTHDRAEAKQLGDSFVVYERGTAARADAI